MSPRDLTSTAAANSARRRDKADDAIRADRSGRLGRFRAFAETAACSTNVSADKIPVYDAADEVLDTRRVRIAQAGGNIAIGLAKFAGGALAARREAFEDLWAGGRQFVYGAVNAGGMGAEGPYGPFCIVFDPQRGSPSALAVFPDDTAQRYTDGLGNVDEAQAIHEVTAWTHRSDLATVERESVVDDDTDRWPELVCCPGQYLEVATWPGPATSDIGEVRLREQYARDLDELQARYGAGDPLTDIELSSVEAYDVIHSWRRSFGTSITEVD